MSHEVNDRYEESLIEWAMEAGLDDILNIEKLTIEEIERIQGIFGRYKDADDLEDAFMVFLGAVELENPDALK